MIKQRRFRFPGLPVSISSTYRGAALVALTLVSCSEGDVLNIVVDGELGGEAGSERDSSGGSDSGDNSNPSAGGSWGGESFRGDSSADASVSEPRPPRDAGLPPAIFDAGSLVELTLPLVDLGTFGLGRIVPETDPDAYQTLHTGLDEDGPAGIGKMSYWAGTQSGPWGTLRAHTERRPYFIYDVSNVQQAERAVLRLWAYQEQVYVNGYGAYTSEDASETLTFYSVEDSSVQDIQTSPMMGGFIDDPLIRADQRAIFEDLGHGVELGYRVFTAQDNEPEEQNPRRAECQGVEACEKELTRLDDEGRPECGQEDATCGHWVELELNAAAVAQINQGNGNWAFGAALTTINNKRHAASTTIVNEWLFPNVRVDLNPARVPEIVAKGMAPPAPQLLVYMASSDPCIEGSCDSGVCDTQPRCEDENPCTVDSCSMSGECSHAPLSDGSSCGLGTVCVNNQCVAGCSIDAACDDADLCNGVESCDLTKFQCRPGTAVSCDNSNSCDGEETCDPATGQCLAGTALDCPIVDVCNIGTCDALSGCSSQPVADGLACGTGQVCLAGVCRPGCSQPGSPCDDANPCTEGDICRIDYSCQPGAARQCPNADTCNVGTCDPSIGCTVEPAVNGLVCGIDSICLAGQCSTGCLQPGGACDDANPCTVGDTCGPDFSCQAGAPASCADDGNPCTVETCELIQGCVSTALAAGTACGEASTCNGLAQCETAVTTIQAPFLDTGTFGLGLFVPSGEDADFQTLHLGDDSGRDQAFGKMAHWAGTQSGPGPFPGVRIQTNRRPYFQFDVSGISRASGARLRLWLYQIQQFTNGVGGYASNDASETFTLFSVDQTRVSDIATSPRISGWNSDPIVTIAQRRIYEDLGDGIELGSRVFTAADNVPLEQNPKRPDCQGVTECLEQLARLDSEGHPECGGDSSTCGRWIEVELNAAALEQINQGTGTWLFGADMTTIDDRRHQTASGIVNEWLFANVRVDLNPRRIPALVAQGMAPPAPQLLVDVRASGVVSCNSDSDCDDANSCNGSERCDSVLGCVSGVVLLCDDGNACNGSERCDALLGCTAGTPLLCGDANVCNGEESCDPVLGCISGDAPNCNFSNECSVGSCSAGLGCVVDSQPDGTVCAGGQGECSAGECQPFCEVGEIRTEVSLDCPREDRGSFHSVAAMPFVVRSPWKHASNHQVRWTGTCVNETCSTPGGALEANRQYQTWDLTRLDDELASANPNFVAGSGRVISAFLIMPHASNSYIDPGNGATETVQFYDVTTPASVLSNPDPDDCACLTSPNTETVVPPIFEDLGSGVVYGSITLDASVNGTDGPAIPLNAAAIEAINAHRGETWSIGGALVSGGEARTFGVVERVWRGGGEPGSLNLTVCVAAP